MEKNILKTLFALAGILWITLFSLYITDTLTIKTENTNDTHPMIDFKKPVIIDNVDNNQLKVHQGDEYLSVYTDPNIAKAIKEYIRITKKHEFILVFKDIDGLKQYVVKAKPYKKPYAKA